MHLSYSMRVCLKALCHILCLYSFLLSLCRVVVGKIGVRFHVHFCFASSLPLLWLSRNAPRYF